MSKLTDQIKGITDPKVFADAFGSDWLTDRGDLEVGRISAKTIRDAMTFAVEVGIKYAEYWQGQKGGTDGINQGTEAGSNSASSS